MTLPLLALCVLASLCVALYLTLLVDSIVFARTGVVVGLLGGAIDLRVAWHFLLSFALCLALSSCVLAQPRIFDALIRWRFVIAAVVLVVCVVLRISGSSTNIWSFYIDGDPYQGTLFGAPRIIRSDEWRVFTPLSVSQCQSGCPALSTYLNGGGHDMTMVYAQPAWALATLFRPSLWGFLFLGAEGGMAFFWVGRLLALLLVTYQLGLKLTNGDRYLSATMAILVAFAPAVQWWFVVNSIAELIIFGEGLVLALDAFLRADRRWKSWLFAGLICWQAGAYLLSLYPAWQVPFFYVFAALGVWVLLRWRREMRQLRHNEDEEALTKTMATVAPGDEAAASEALAADRRRAARSHALRVYVAPLAGCLAVLVALLAVVFMSSWETISAVLNTAYPGARQETGGSLLRYLAEYTTMPLTPINPYSSGYVGNICESATMISLFPLGFLVGSVAGVRKHDLCLGILTAVTALFLVYGLVGLPLILAKVTLLTLVPSGRLLLPLGFLEVVFLVRGLSLRDGATETGARTHSGASARDLHLRAVSDGAPFHPEGHTPAAAAPSPAALTLSVAAALAFATAYTLVAYRITPAGEVGWACYVLIFAFAFMGSLVVLMPQGIFSAWGLSRGASLLVASLLVAAVGLTVNPVQQGLPALTESDFVKDVRAVSEKDPDALWITSELIGQVVPLGQAKTLSSTWTYPDLDFWAQLDPTGAYENQYNRYAHVAFVLADAGAATSFELLGPDSLCVHISNDDLVKLGIRYWVTNEDLTAASTDTVSFEPISPAGSDYTIYHVTPH